MRFGLGTQYVSQYWLQIRVRDKNTTHHSAARPQWVLGCGMKRRVPTGGDAVAMPVTEPVLPPPGHWSVRASLRTHRHRPLKDIHIQASYKDERSAPHTHTRGRRLAHGWISRVYAPVLSIKCPCGTIHEENGFKHKAWHARSTTHEVRGHTTPPSSCPPHSSSYHISRALRSHGYNVSTK